MLGNVGHSVQEDSPGKKWNDAVQSIFHPMCYHFPKFIEQAADAVATFLVRMKLAKQAPPEN